MPMGCFVILLPIDSDYKVLGYYFKEGKLDFKITNDLFLRLNLDHSKNEFNLLKVKDLYSIFSYFYKFTGKLARKAIGIIIGLLLNEDDKPERFRSSLKEAGEAFEIPSLDILNKSKEEIEIVLKDIYLEHLEPLIDILQPDALKTSVINITKYMLSGGKKERNLAQELVKSIESSGACNEI